MQNKAIFLHLLLKFLMEASLQWWWKCSLDIQSSATFLLLQQSKLKKCMKNLYNRTLHIG